MITYGTYMREVLKEKLRFLGIFLNWHFLGDWKGVLGKLKFWDWEASPLMLVKKSKSCLNTSLTNVMIAGGHMQLPSVAY